MMKLITIGSDPEFIITNSSGKQVDAGPCLKSIRGKYCENKSNGEDCSTECAKKNPFCANLAPPQIGEDCGLGELRPSAGNNPYEHMDNLSRLFKYIKLPTGFHAYAGTIYKGAAMGGHIHIGLKTLDSSLANYLSYYCGIPLRKIERKEDIKQRGLDPDTYGFYGRYHEKNYGIEWRMPASWLLDKKITLAALSLSYIAAIEYSNNPKNFAISYNAYYELVKGNIDKIIIGIEKMKGFKYYHKEIEPLLQMIINNETWDTTRDIIEEWE